MARIRRLFHCTALGSLVLDSFQLFLQKNLLLGQFAQSALEDLHLAIQLIVQFASAFNYLGVFVNLRHQLPFSQGLNMFFFKVLNPGFSLVQLGQSFLKI